MDEAKQPIMDADAIQAMVDRMVTARLEEAATGKGVRMPMLRGSKISAFSGQKLTDKNVRNAELTDDPDAWARGVGDWAAEHGPPDQQPPNLIKAALTRTVAPEAQGALASAAGRTDGTWETLDAVEEGELHAEYGTRHKGTMLRGLAAFTADARTAVLGTHKVASKSEAIRAMSKLQRKSGEPMPVFVSRLRKTVDQANAAGLVASAEATMIMACESADLDPAAETAMRSETYRFK